MTRKSDFFSKLAFSAALFAGIFLLIFLNKFGFLDVFKNFVIGVSAPIQEISGTAANKVVYFGRIFFEIKNLKQENEKLAAANLELTGKLAQLNEIGKENDYLRQQLGLEGRKDYHLILADIIGRDPAVSGRSATVNKGAKNGLRPKMAVIAAGDILVGQVSEVFDDYAKVRFLEDALSKVPALSQDSRLDGVIRGDGSQLLTMDFILKEGELKAGESVVSSGLGGIYPKNLLIGSVEQILVSDNQFFQKAKIKPTVNFQNLEEVFIINDL